MTKEEIIDFCEMKSQLEPENEDIFNCIIKALEQEPFINKPCVSSGVCEHDKQKVLSEIRAEIEEKFGNYDICEWFEDYDYEENDISEYQSVGDVSDILAIIDKHRAESEDKE